MSFLDTIALPLFIAIIGLVALVFIASWAYAQSAEARAKMLERKRDLRLERQAFDLIESIFAESNSLNGLDLPQELADQLWTVHDQIDRKKLTR